MPKISAKFQQGHPFGPNKGWVGSIWRFRPTSHYISNTVQDKDSYTSHLLSCIFRPWLYTQYEIPFPREEILFHAFNLISSKTYRIFAIKTFSKSIRQLHMFKNIHKLQISITAYDVASGLQQKIN